MSNFKLQIVGTYAYTVNKQGKPMIRVALSKEQIDKVKEWDFDKFYIYEPKKSGGDILGLVEIKDPPKLAKGQLELTTK